ncbi:MAG: hypothetical protein ABR573_09440 [Candidatus Dormibacteria bacterium]
MSGERTPEEAARWAADPSRLMGGEDPQTLRLSDAIHWMEVYEELVTVKDELIATALSRLADLDPEASAEIRGSDMVLLKAERERFIRRLAFWKERHRELEDGAEQT